MANEPGNIHKYVSAKRNPLLVLALIAGTVLWTVGVFKWVEADTEQLKLLGVGPEAGPQTCQDAGFEAATGSPGPDLDAGSVAAATTADPVTFEVGDARGATRDVLVLPMTSDGDLPGSGSTIEVAATALSKDGGGTLDAPSVSATVMDDQLVIDICALVPAKITFVDYAGSYHGTIVITDERFQIEPIDVTVKVQARYIWLLAPAVMWIPLLAWAVVGKGGFWTISGLASLLTAGAGAASIYAASGLNDATWGGGIAPAFALLGLMFGAATGVLATANKAGQLPTPPPAAVTTLTPDPPEGGVGTP